MNYEEYRKAWKEYPLKHIVGRFPLHLDIETNTDCQLQCPECPNHSPNARYPPLEKEAMDFDIYKKIIDEDAEKGLCATTLCFRGEPLLYDTIIGVIQYAKRKGIMDVRLNSNGLLLNKMVCIDLISANLDLFILSDYGIPKQLENVKALQELKKILASDKPLLKVKTKDKEKWEGIADEIAPLIFHNYNSGLEYIKKTSFDCEQLYQRLTVLANGDIKMCCSSVMYSDSILGNIKFNTIEEVWKSDYLNYIRFCHKNQQANLIKSCRFCPGVIEYENNKMRLEK